MKIRLFFLITLLITSLHAQVPAFILHHDGLVDQRAQDKMKQIHDEVKSKLGVNLYLDVKEDNGIDPSLPREDRIAMMRKKEDELRAKMVKPYAVLTISINQLYTSILYSKDLDGVIDKSDILDGYVIPLLASKDKNTLFAKTSAATLNGFAQIGDSIASSRDIELESSIGSEGKTAGTIWRVFMYTIVLIGIGAYAVIVMREKKYKGK
ncbi:MAG: hypothetical protein U9Q04_05865 [Campylobacterota bacterium]|nr:hypothetical protein [Campylobacterota bacterium]